MADGPSSSPGRIALLMQRVVGDRADGTDRRSTELRGSETAKAVGLAAAMIGNNIIALGSTVVFSRLLKDNQGGGYGSLAALVSYFLILSVVGQAIQVATAREGVLGHLGVGAGLIGHRPALDARPAAVHARAHRRLGPAARPDRERPLNVKHDQWAAALGLPAAGLWVELSMLRGVLQGVGDYKGVGISLIGEQSARLVTGAHPGRRRPRRDRGLPGDAAVVHRHERVLPSIGCAGTSSRSRPSPWPPSPRRRRRRSACGSTSGAPGRRSPG